MIHLTPPTWVQLYFKSNIFNLVNFAYLKSNLKTLNKKLNSSFQT